MIFITYNSCHDKPWLSLGSKIFVILVVITELLECFTCFLSVMYISMPIVLNDTFKYNEL